MAAPINVPFSLANTETLVIPTNRWGQPRYSLQVTAGAALLEGTLIQLNRTDRITGVAPTPVWTGLDDIGGTAITAQGAGIVQVAEVPVEAVRITATGATTGIFQQQGQVT